MKDFIIFFNIISEMRFGGLVQFSSLAQSCEPQNARLLCNPMNRKMPGFPIHHQLPESTKTHVH